LMGIERDMQNERLTFEQTNLFKELKNAVTLGQIDMFGAIDLQEEINKGNIAEANTVLEGIKETAKATVDVAKEQRGAAVDVAKTEERIVEAELDAEGKRLTAQLDSDQALARIDAKSRTDIQRAINDGDYAKADLLMEGEKALQSEALSFEQENLIKELKAQINLANIDAGAAKYIQREITKGNIETAKTALEGVKAGATATVDVAKEQRGAAVDVAVEQRAGATEIANIDAAMQTEALTYQQANLLSELKNAINLANIDAGAAKYIQRQITDGNVKVAETALEGVKAGATATVDVAKEQRGAAVDVAVEQRGSAKEIAKIDEAMQSERLTFEQSNLLESLKNEVTLGRLEAGTRKSIQNAIIKGDLAEARQQLDYAREIATGTVTVDGEERETLDAIQQREDNKYREGLATGYIGGKQTVDYLLADRAADVNQQRADLETDLANLEITKYMGDRTSQALADLLALVGTLPEGDQRDSVMNRIGAQIEQGVLTPETGLTGTVFEDMISEIADTGSGRDAQTMELLGYKWVPNNRGGGQWVHEDYQVQGEE